MSGILKHRAASKSGRPADYARFLELCAGQLEIAVGDAREKADLVSRSAITTAGRLAELGAAGSRDAADAAEKMNELFVHLQFADRLDQRIGNVRRILLLLAEHADCGGQTWQELLDRVRESYTMEEERRAFDATFAPAGSDGEPEAGRVQLFAADDHDV